MLDEKRNRKILMLKTTERLGSRDLVRDRGCEGLTKLCLILKGKKNLLGCV